MLSNNSGAIIWRAKLVTSLPLCYPPGQGGYRAAPHGAVPAGYMGYAGGGVKMGKKGKMKKVKGMKVGKKPKMSKYFRVQLIFSMFR